MMEANRTDRNILGDDMKAFTNGNFEHPRSASERFALEDRTSPAYSSRRHSTICPDQRMTRDEALKAYTLTNACAAFIDHLKGSMTLGKYADFTLLSQDLTKVPEEKISETKILYTIVGGKIEYKLFTSASPRATIPGIQKPAEDRSTKSGRIHVADRRKVSFERFGMKGILGLESGFISKTSPAFFL
jgi:hypothetical protein